MFVIGSNSASTGYNLTRSLRFRSSASAYLNRTLTTPTNNKIWTLNLWLKIGTVAGGGKIFSTNVANTPFSSFYYDTNANLTFYEYTGTNYVLTTTQVFRDPSAWYMFTIVMDTTQATASNRTKFYVNGTQITSFSSASYVPQNTNTTANSAVATFIGQQGNSGGYFDGYLAEVNFIDGQALTPSSFGSTNATTGVWQPAQYTGTYGTNGFYLPFTDNSALTTASNVGLGKDFSGNGNYWVTNNISITAGVTYDSMTDVPTLTSATASNFAVLNPLDTSAVTTISNGNLYTYLSASGSAAIRATIASTSGKFYWEVTFGATGDTLMVGVCDASVSIGSALWSGANAWMYYSNNGNKYLAGSGTAYGATFTANDVIGVALDLGAGTLVFYKNNTSQGTATSSLAGKNLTATIQSAARALDVYVNFGQRPFTYTAPTGFVALNTYNLPTSTIVKGNTVMDATIYTGAGGTQSITNAAGFKPDLVWAKSRSNAFDHAVYDSVRGAGTAKYLITNATSAEGNYSNSYGSLSSFNSNGFTVATGTDPTNPNAFFNQSAATYVAWQWQAGQGSSSSNTNGTITSTVSVNASAGFSVVTYTGTGGASATVGHGLGVAPSLIIVKERGSNVSGWNAWTVYHSSIGATGNLVLNTTAATNTAVYGWNNTAPTSSVFTIAYSAGAGVNYTSTYVAYCWTPIAGFSAFGSYTGNGSTDGPFVYTGFRPKFVMIKVTSTTQPWIIIDTARNTYNVAGDYLMADSSSAENALSPISTATALDILSNGFKLRNNASSSGYTNASSATYIYMAYAENPLKNALAR